jgi:7,8-dihydro-6-hydroxymethylpterin-pyrophosphokinase
VLGRRLPAAASAEQRRRRARGGACACSAALVTSCQLTAHATQVVIALGSNQGDRAELLRAAARALPAAGIAVRAFSSLYETAAAYVTDQARWRLCVARAPRPLQALTRVARASQPPFLNAAVSGTTQLEPDALLGALKRLEAELGRTSGGQARACLR